MYHCRAKLTVLVLLIALFACNKTKKSTKTLRQASLPDTSIVKVSILNGCGVKGAASSVRAFLAFNKNIDVIKVGNTKNLNFNKTLIAVRKANTLKQHFLMNVTKIDRRILALTEKSTSEFDIILGKDYKQYFGSNQRLEDNK